jgi:methylase of polypeptide subunit release factors
VIAPAVNEQACKTSSPLEVSTTTDYWDFGRDQEPLMHRIHAYPAKFPAFITQKAVCYARERGVVVGRIADVFCGCGTTALEAKRLNTAFWGCDINPVATLIARVKSHDYKPTRLELCRDQVLASYAQCQQTHIPQLNNERLHYWYDDAQIIKLAHLKAAIETLAPGKYRNFFLCAFSNILKPTSRWLTKSIKPQIDPNKKPAEVSGAFTAQVDLMLKAVRQCDKHNHAESKIETCNFLDMSIDEPIADLIITSPPYVTSYEYADLHQLSTLWLDFTDDYRKLRNGTIGSLYHNSDFNRDILCLNATGHGIVSRVHDVDRRKARATAKYFIDMDRTVKKCHAFLRPTGMVLFVIGNTEYKGVKIDNAGYLSDCMAAASFSDIEVTKRKISRKTLTPYRDPFGRFSANSASRHVYAEEFIVTGRN